MIPIRDLNVAARPPRVTLVLIALNVVVFVLGWQLGEVAQNAIIGRFGLVPAFFSTGAVLVPGDQGGALPYLLTPLTSMFVHGGVVHLVGNMWFLYVFGDNVEDALGHGRFLFFYLLSGIGAACAQIIVEPASNVPMVGASGAISGVLGAYLVLYPRARVLVLVPIFVVVSFFEWPAYLVVGEWFFVQVFAGLFSLAAPGGGGVAWFAHIGGFLVGLLSVRALTPEDEPIEEVSRRVRRR
jgi:membrane associated rhomboid family serine protease